MNFGEMLARGMGVAGWLIGFVAVLGGFLIVVGIIGLLLIEAAKIIWPAEDTEKGKDEKYEREDYQSVR